MPVSPPPPLGAGLTAGFLAAEPDVSAFGLGALAGADAFFAAGAGVGTDTGNFGFVVVVVVVEVVDDVVVVVASGVSAGEPNAASPDASVIAVAVSLPRRAPRDAVPSAWRSAAASCVSGEAERPLDCNTTVPIATEPNSPAATARTATLLRKFPSDSYQPSTRLTCTSHKHISALVSLSQGKFLPHLVMLH